MKLLLNTDELKTLYELFLDTEIADEGDICDINRLQVDLSINQILWLKEFCSDYIGDNLGRLDADLKQILNKINGILDCPYIETNINYNGEEQN